MKNVNELKGFSRLGDSLLNFAYSLALSLITGEPQGARLPDKILIESAREAGLKEALKIKHRIKRDELADLVEAIIAIGWLKGDITLGQIVKVIAKGMDIYALSSPRLMNERLVNNIKELLEKIKELGVEPCLGDFQELLRRRLEASS